jgi:O-acetyl-ADP-ribose deacetylase (regulator of RNase III)
MQMARFYDRSLSATIRYEGARKDEHNRIDDDTIANELAMKLGTREWVVPGTVYVTGAGALTDSLGVKKIFHAATVQGVPGHGYQVIQGVERCVTYALQKMDQKNYRDDGLRTIVFPIMGTGEGGGDLQEIAPKLIRAAISYFTTNPNSNVTKVYFSAWSQRQLEVCQAALTPSAGVEPIEPIAS